MVNARNNDTDDISMMSEIKINDTFHHKESKEHIFYADRKTAQKTSYLNKIYWTIFKPPFVKFDIKFVWMK